MRCYACGRSLTNDAALTNYGLWTNSSIEGERQPYCAYDAWCGSYTLKAEEGDEYFGTTAQEKEHVRASVDPWFRDHECDSRCDRLGPAAEGMN